MKSRPQLKKARAPRWQLKEPVYSQRSISEGFIIVCVLYSCMLEFLCLQKLQTLL